MKEEAPKTKCILMHVHSLINPRIDNFSSGGTSTRKRLWTYIAQEKLTATCTKTRWLFNFSPAIIFYDIFALEIT